MKKKLISLFTTLAMTISLLPVFSAGSLADPLGTWADHAAASFAGGDGSANNPYQIATSEQLGLLAKNTIDASTYSNGLCFAITADIDLNGYYWQPIVLFEGTLDGKGHVISNMLIDSPATTRMGLISTIDEAVVKNLGLTNVSVSGLRDSGALIGWIDGLKEKSTVSGCFSTGSITTVEDTVGGLIGWARAADIINCYSTCAVSTDNTYSNAGGLLGDSYSNVTVTNCYAAGAVTNPSSNKDRTGGLVGGVDSGVSVGNSYYNSVNLAGKGGGYAKSLTDMALPAFVLALNNSQAPTVWCADTLDINSGLPTFFTCAIGSAKYYSLTDALNAVGAGENKTIKLLGDIDYTTDIVVGGKTVVFDLNGHTLNVILNPNTGTFGLNVGNGTIDITSEGEFNVSSYGILVNEGGTVTVTNVTSSIDCAVNAAGSGAMVNIKGSIVTASGIGAYAHGGAKVVVEGSITSPTYIKAGDTVKDGSAAGRTEPTTKEGYYTYSDGASTVWVKCPSLISAVSAGSPTLTSTGGTNVITVSGSGLSNGIKVTAFISGTATAVTGTTSGTATSQTVALTFPQNTGSSDLTYTIKVSLDGGAKWDTKTTELVVSKPAPVYFDTTPSAKKVAVTTSDGKTSVNGSLTESRGTVQVSIEGKAFDELASSNKDVNISAGSVKVTFDSAAMDEISAKAGTTEVALSMRKLEPAELSEPVNTLVGNKQVYNFSLTGGGKQISSFGGGYASISIPYTLRQGEKPECVIVYYLNAKAALEITRGHYNVKTGSVEFITPHFSNFVIAYNSVSFTDVQEENWYCSAVDFLAARGITQGTGTGTFSPDAKLERGEFIVMLLRAYGITPLTALSDNFTDAGDAYYTPYLAAAKQLGIASGIGGDMFAPEQQLTRQEMFVLIYRAMAALKEVPASSNVKTLGDFNDGGSVESWASDAVTALIGAGIVEGTEDKLNPNDMSTRAEMAQLLYRIHSE